MKFIHSVFIDGQLREASDHTLVLEANAGGRGALTVKGYVEKGQRVRIDLGIAGSNVAQWFTGFVTQVTPNETGYYRIIIRELCFLLDSPQSVSFQHTTIPEILAAITDNTGLQFVLPQNSESHYQDEIIANFSHQGSGYQLLNNIGRAFEIPDFTWYQQPDGFIWLGSYRDTKWAHNPVVIPPELTTASAGGNVMQCMLFPPIRPHAWVNGKAINKVVVVGDEMTLTWRTPAEQTTPEQRQIRQAFPELAAGYHLPKFGVVVAVADKAMAGQVNDPFRPRYAADVQILDENGQSDKTVPVYKALPLPVGAGGNEQGNMATPTEGTMVELAFAYGRADKAFIRTILGYGWSLPDIAPDEQLLQQRAEVFQRTTPNGHQHRATDGHQTDEAMIKQDVADRYTGTFGQQRLQVDGLSYEEVGRKVIESLGNVEIMAGDNIELGTLGNLHTATAGELVDIIGGLRRSVAGETQHYQAPQTWLGNSKTNILQLLQRLMVVMEAIAKTSASHTHNGSSAPDQASQFTSQSNQVKDITETLTPMIKA